jgi:integrase
MKTSITKTKYSGVSKLKSGLFQVQISLGTDSVTGKRNRLKTTTNDDGKPFESATEAYHYLTIVKAKYFKTGAYTASKMTFECFFNDEYVPWYKITVRPQTFESRKPILKGIKKYFGKKMLKDITIKDVNDYQIWIKNKGFSQSYASQYFSNFKRILQHAVQLGYLVSNPANKVKALPKGRANVDFWTKAEFEKVLSVICINDFYEHLMYVMIVLYFTTGLRVNEATALSWEDVDFKKKTLHVWKNIVPQGKRKNWKPTHEMKTENAERTISLDDATLGVLRKWHKRQHKAGVDRYILTYDGLPLGKYTISRNLKKYAKLAGVHPIQAKGLRHSHASYLIHEFNIDILKLSRRLGHSSAEITLRHYGHLYPNPDQDIAQKMSSDFSFTSAKETKSKFKGNQSVKMAAVPRLSPSQTNLCQ